MPEGLALACALRSIGIALNSARRKETSMPDKFLAPSVPAAAVASHLESPFGGEPFHAYYPRPAPTWLTRFCLLFFLVAIPCLMVTILQLG
jgi:hypothetical protein